MGLLKPQQAGEDLPDTHLRLDPSYPSTKGGFHGEGKSKLDGAAGHAWAQPSTEGWVLRSLFGKLESKGKAGGRGSAGGLQGQRAHCRHRLLPAGTLPLSFPQGSKVQKQQNPWCV